MPGAGSTTSASRRALPLRAAPDGARDCRPTREPRSADHPDTYDGFADRQIQRAAFRQYFSQRGFDPRAEVGIFVAGIEHIIAQSFRDAPRATDGKKRALHRNVPLDAFEKLAALYQETGLVDRCDFLLPPDDEGQKADRIPSGEETQKLFDAVNVAEGELVSDADRALLYGDQAAAEAVECEVRDSRREP